MAWTWAGQRAGKDDIAAALQVHDHGLPLDDRGQPRPAHQSLVTADEEAAAERAALRIDVDRCADAIVEAFRWQVRVIAADAEPKRARKAEAAARAADHYDLLIGRGKQPAEAAREALREPPPR